MESTHESMNSVRRANWLIRLRWIGVLGVLLATFVGDSILDISLQIRALYLLGVVLACYNGAIWYWVSA